MGECAYNFCLFFPLTYTLTALLIAKERIQQYKTGSISYNSVSKVRSILLYPAVLGIEVSLAACVLLLCADETTPNVYNCLLCESGKS